MMHIDQLDQGCQGIGYSGNSASESMTAPETRQWLNSHIEQQQQYLNHQQVVPNLVSQATQSAQAILNAQAIAMKFHTQSIVNNNQVPTNEMSKHCHKLQKQSKETTTYNTLNANFITQACNSSTASVIQCRELYERRLQKALLKNFEYISRKDEEALQRQLHELERTRHLSSQLENHSQCALQKRQMYQSQKKKQKMNNNEPSFPATTTMAGIGTGIRKKQQKTEYSQVYGHLQQQNAEKRSSVYVSGIRVGKKNVTQIEKNLTQLFVSYGKIHRVRVYRDSASGKVKGDVLITYDTLIDVDMVCSQLNGAELPCGSVLNVQPANFDAKRNKQSKIESETYGVGSEIMNTLKANHENNENADKRQAPKIEEKQNKNEAAVATADLDDFFDSL